MSRSKNGVTSRKRHKKILRLAKGYRNRSKNCFTIANQKVEKALTYAYRDRRKKKSFFRALWIQRINAFARSHGMNYSIFMYNLKKMNIRVNRKIISETIIKKCNISNILMDRLKMSCSKKM